MSFIRKQYNSKTKTTYVYEVESYWDPKTKMPRSHSKLLGKEDPISGKLVPTGKRGRPKKSPPANTSGTESGNDATISEVKKKLLEAQQKNLQLESANRTSREEIKRLKEKLHMATTTLDLLKKAFDRHIEALEE